MGTQCPACTARWEGEGEWREWWREHQEHCAGSSMGRRLREEGEALVSAHNVDFLKVIRKVATAIAVSQGQVTIDELRGWAETNGLKPDHPNAWGAVFTGNEWEQVGEVPSSVPSNHARRVRVWRLK